MSEIEYLEQSIKKIVSIPEDHDEEEYIDELLESILNEDLRYNAEWDFVD